MVPLNQRGNYDQYHAYLDKLQQDRNSRERGPVTPFGKRLVVEVVVLVLFATSVIQRRTPNWL